MITLMYSTSDKWNLIAPHKVTRPDHVYELAADMMRNGWKGDTLVGYVIPSNGMIQLLTGTHRREAAAIAGISIPVKVWPHSMIEAAFGHPLVWNTIITSGSR